MQLQLIVETLYNIRRYGIANFNFAVGFPVDSIVVSYVHKNSLKFANFSPNV